MRAITGSVRGVLQNRLRISGHGMRVMSEVTNPLAREHTMTKVEGKGEVIDIKAVLEGDADFLRAAVKAAIEAALEAEMTETLGAAKGERTEARLGYRSGYYHRSLITRVGTLELRVPQDRAGRFSTELFERYQRSEKALVSALAEMYVQGVSTRKVKAVTETLCGHEFSASTISKANKSLDAALTAFSRRRLKEPYPYLILDARYEKGAMILTSNRGFAEWGDIFGSPVVATALLDRLLHHAIVIQIEGSSYRMREHAALLPENIRANTSGNSATPKRPGRPPTKQPTSHQHA